MVGSNTALIAAVDVDEDGKLDIICQTFSTTDSKFDLKFIYNNKYLDSFFLKGLMVFKHQGLDEATQELATPGDGEKRLGDMAVGASLRFVTTSISDVKVVRAGW
jgi:hypothetical protein